MNLAQWIYVATFVLLALAIAIAIVVFAVRLAFPSQFRIEGDGRWPRAVRLGVWIFVTATFALSIYAVVLHIGNWNEWHRVLDADTHIPYHSDYAQVTVGFTVLLSMGLVPAVIAWVHRRRLLSGGTLLSFSRRGGRRGKGDHS